MKFENGFTLPELMATLVVAGILAALAAPAFNGFIANERLRAEANDMVGMFFTARSEAIKRNRRVTVCKLNATGANSCTATGVPAPQCACSTTSGDDWSNGWMTFVDVDANGVFNGTDTALDIAWAPTGSVAVDPLAGDATIRNYVSFISRGTVRETTADGGSNQSGTIRLCDDRGVQYGRVVTIANTGRVRTLGPPDSTALLGGTCP